MQDFYGMLATIVSLMIIVNLRLCVNFYRNQIIFFTIRMLLLAFLVADTLWYYYVVMVPGYDNPSSKYHFLKYFYLEACALARYAAIIFLIYPKQKLLTVFFPIAIVGPLLTFCLPTFKPAELSFSFFNFYFAHSLTTVSFLYLYWYGKMTYQINKTTIGTTFKAGIVIILIVELFNQYFGTNYILGDIVNALGITAGPRYWVLLFVLFFVLPVCLLIAHFIIYLFPPLIDHHNKRIDNINFFSQVKQIKWFVSSKLKALLKAN